MERRTRPASPSWRPFLGGGVGLAGLGRVTLPGDAVLVANLILQLRSVVLFHRVIMFYRTRLQ